jgi:hypothetical protein
MFSLTHKAETPIVWLRRREFLTPGVQSWSSVENVESLLGLDAKKREVIKGDDEYQPRGI